MFLSVVIPTYNRLPILRQCLMALEVQQLVPPLSGYEVVLVDDGSSDDTVGWIADHRHDLPHLRLIEQEHGGPALGRNRGVSAARGDVVVFIDSDLVVRPDFLVQHARALAADWAHRGDRLSFTYGAVINTANFEEPTAERHKLRDLSWAYFATGNVAIERQLLERAGLFDTAFRLYGWEDLELGERLRRLGVRLVRCPAAVGYHWHPALDLARIPQLIQVERERAHMALVFFRKHPTRRVRFIVQYTWLHRLLWELATAGGLINERTLLPLLRRLIRWGHPGLAMELLRLPLNRIGVQALFREARRQGLAAAGTARSR